MVTMTPVVERYLNCPFWPVDPGPEAYLQVTSDEARIGALAWALVAQGMNPAIETATSAVEAVEAFLTLGDGAWYASGGLRVVAGDVVVDPRCCAELGEWRAWSDVLAGQVVWPGHQQEVRVEQDDVVVRWWQEDDTIKQPFDPPRIGFPRDTLPGLLEDVRRDLLGFLAALDNWAHTTVPTQADRLVATVDRRLAISPPLDL